MIAKYRGKRIDNNEWVYGMPVETEKRCWLVSSPGTSFADRDLMLYYIEVDPRTVGQHGLVSDDSWRNIFEGDNLQITCTCGKSFKATVKRSEATLYIGLSPNCDCKKIPECHYIPINDVIEQLSDLDCQVKIIGNIHDKELVKP